MLLLQMLKRSKILISANAADFPAHMDIAAPPIPATANYAVQPPNQPIQYPITWWSGYGGVPGTIPTRRPSSAPLLQDPSWPRPPTSPAFSMLDSSASYVTGTPAVRPFKLQDPYSTFFNTASAGSDLRRYSISRPQSPKQVGKWNVPMH